MVVVVEIFRRNFLASMVPVIVNAILNEHQLVIDIVAFVIKGDFHRSRLGEKQRGKILAGWVTRKMRTIAQYSIRDPNGPENQMMISEEPANRASMSIRGPGSTKGSLRGGSMLGITAQLNSMQLQQQQASAIQHEISGQSAPGNFALSQSPIQAPHSDHHYPAIPEDKTPTEARHSFLPGTAMDYSPIDRNGPYADQHMGPGEHNYQNQSYGNSQVPDILRPGPEPDSEPFYSDSQPYDYTPEQHQQSYPQQHAQHDDAHQQRWSFDDDDRPVGGYDGHGTGAGGGGGGLRVANFDDSDDGAPVAGGLRVANRNSTASGESWTRDALAGLEFVGGRGQH